MYKSECGRIIYTLRDGQVKCVDASGTHFISLANRHKEAYTRYKGFTSDDSDEIRNDEIKKMSMLGLKQLNSVSNEVWVKIK